MEFMGKSQQWDCCDFVFSFRSKSMTSFTRWDSLRTMSLQCLAPRSPSKKRWICNTNSFHAFEFKTLSSFRPGPCLLRVSKACATTRESESESLLTTWSSDQIENMSNPEAVNKQSGYRGTMYVQSHSDRLNDLISWSFCRFYLRHSIIKCVTLTPADPVETAQSARGPAWPGRLKVNPCFPKSDAFRRNSWPGKQFGAVPISALPAANLSVDMAQLFLVLLSSDHRLQCKLLNKK